MEFKKAYLTFFPEFESSKEEMILNRYKIKFFYFRKIQINVEIILKV